MDRNRPPNLAAVAIVRNEAPYLLEWIAHHRVVGFSRFYIADNLSNDGTTELLLALDRLDIVRCISFPTPEGQAPQFPAYEKLLHEYAHEEEWVALIDADEFVVPLTPHRTVSGALGTLFAQPDVGAIGLNWACYGSSWRQNRTAGLVMERFVRRALQKFGPNHHYKTILRRAAFSRILQNPHHIGLLPGFRYLRADGSDVRTHEKLGLGLSHDVLWEGARINHYLVKSRQEFEENKRPKGRVSLVGGTKGEKYFVGHDRNDVGDPVAAWLLSAVKAEMETLRRVLHDAGYEVPAEPSSMPVYDRPFEEVRGYVDALENLDGRVRVRGWAMHWSGLPPVSLALELAGNRHLFLGYEHQKRSDVARSFPMACEYCGFELVVPVREPVMAKDVRLFAGYGPSTPFGPFGISDRV